MAKKTDTTVDDPDLLEDGGQLINEPFAPDYTSDGLDDGLFDGGLFGGGLGDVIGADGGGVNVLPPFVTTENKLPSGTIFDPSQLNQAPELTGATPAVSAGGPAIIGGPTPIDVKTKAGTTMSSEELTKVIVDRIAQREAQIGRSLKNEEIDSVVGDVMYDIWGPVAAGGTNKPLNVQGGIPLVLPIPGLDPASAAILTAAGLIFSGGKIARLNPNDPLGSIVQAGQGVVQTGQNVVNVATGEDTLGNIWSGGTSGTTGTGSGAAAAGQQTTTGALPVVGAGILSNVSGGGGPFSGPVATTQQQTTTGAPVTVTAGALGGSTSTQTSGGSGKPSGSENVPATGGPYIFDQSEKTGAILATILGPSQAINQAKAEQEAAAAGATGTGTGTIGTGTGTGTGGGTGGGGGDTTTGGSTTGVIGTGTTGTGTTGTGDTTPQTGTTGVTGTGTGGGGGGGGTSTGGGGGQTGTAGGETTPSTGGPGYVGTGGGGGGGGTTTGGPTGGAPSTPIFTMPFTFTKTTPGDVALRDFEKEFGLTSSTLMGQAGQDLAKYYQQLQSQFTPSSLTQLAGTSQQQLQTDFDRYQAAMQGQLSPEDIRAAQQGAREAYAARGQVFSPGAVGAEILGRDQLMRQRQAEARANLQQSLGNVGAAAQLQTGNIFAPFANLLAKTYSPTSEYANAVYDYNVNAYNAYQAAQENLAAYKEAAAKGEQAQFINTFANFLANNGIQTTQNALAKFFQSLLPKG